MASDSTHNNNNSNPIDLGVRGAVWFSFNYKSHSNCGIKLYAIQFSSVGF
jgi:hypothetical protein